MSRITKRQRQAVPLAGSDYALDFVSAQMNENIYPETAGAAAKPVLRSIPGTQTFSNTSGIGRGLHKWGEKLYAVAGDTIYYVDSTGGATSLGSIPGNDLVSMADNGLQLAVATGTALYSVTTSVALVVDADAPLNPVSVDFLDAYILAVDGNTQTFAWSSLDDVTTWDGLDFASAEGAPDNLVGLRVDHREVWLAGTDSMEVWFNDGTTPFSRSSGGYIEKGCASGKTLQKLDNTIYWLGTDKIHGPAVYRAAGLQPERVSTTAIDEALASYGDVSGAYAFTYAEKGHAFYVLTVPGKGTWVYDAAVNEWHRRTTWNSDDYDIVSVVRCYNKLLGQKRTGQVVELSRLLNTDEGEVIRRRRVMPTLDLNGRRFSVMRTELLASVGTAALTETPEVEIEVSKDRGKTWGDPQTRSYGSTGDYEKRLIWGPFGGFRQYTARITTTSDIVATWGELIMDIEVHDH